MRFTSHNFEAYKQHACFNGIEWGKLGTEDQQEFEFQDVNNLLERNATSGLYSPKEEVCDVNKGTFKRQLITFEQLHVSSHCTQIDLLTNEKQIFINPSSLISKHLATLLFLRSHNLLSRSALKGCVTTSPSLLQI